MRAGKNNVLQRVERRDEADRLFRRVGGRVEQRVLPIALEGRCQWREGGIRASIRWRRRRGFHVHGGRGGGLRRGSRRRGQKFGLEEFEAGQALLKCLLDHLLGNGSENLFHHGQMFEVVVRLEEGFSGEKFHQDTPNGPDIAGIRPPKSKNNFGSPVMPCGYYRGVIFAVKSRRSKINQPNIRLIQNARSLGFAFLL